MFFLVTSIIGGSSSRQSFVPALAGFLVLKLCPIQKKYRFLHDREWVMLYMIVHKNSMVQLNTIILKNGLNNVFQVRWINVKNSGNPTGIYKCLKKTPPEGRRKKMV